MNEPDGTGHIAAIPDGEGRRTSALSMAVRAVDQLRQMVLPIVAVVYGTQNFGMTIGTTVAIAVAVLAVAVGSQWLSWWRLRYFIGREDIRVESGLLSLAKRSVPFERIQDVSLEQKLIPRLFGLVEVRFETGAGGKDELHLAHVSAAEGERLRELVRERQDDAVPGSVGGNGGPEPGHREVAEKDEGRVLFAMGPKRIFLFGLFEFSLVVFAVLAGLAQQLDLFLDFEIWDPDVWRAWLGQGGERLSGIGRAGQMLGALAGLAVLILVGLLTGIVRTAAREWGFVLTRTAKGFRRQRGLFTRTDVLMPAHRVQAVSLGAGFVRRLFGWHSLNFVSLAQDSGSANHSVAPFAKRSETDPIALEAGIDLSMEDLDWAQPSARYWIDRVLVAAAFGAVIAAGWVVAGRPAVGGAVFAAILSGAAVLNGLASLRHRYARDRSQLYVRSGFLSRRWTVARQMRLQSVEISQGPLARLGNYGDIHFGLAGGSLRIRGVRIGDAQPIREAVLARIAAIDYSALGRPDETFALHPLTPA